MGASDYFAKGQWNAFCDLCGAKKKSGQVVRTWDGFRVCASHKEARNPQDLLRGVKDDQSVPWSRPEPTDTFILMCTLQGRNAIPGYAVPGCAVPAFLNLAFLPSFQ